MYNTDAELYDEIMYDLFGAETDEELEYALDCWNIEDCD